MTGIRGFARAADPAAHFGVPAALAVNKYDINADNTAAPAREAERRGIPVVGRVPFDGAFTAAQRERKTVVERGAGAAAKALAETWTALLEFLEKRA